MRNVTPTPSPKPGRFRRVAWIVAGLLALGVAILFPRMLAFVELAARELRYLWWLILLAALGGYFFFFFGRKKE